MQDRLGNDLFYIVILRLRPGSVVGDLLFAVPKEEAVDVNDIQTSLNDVLRSKFGNENEVQGKWCWDSFSAMVWGFRGQIYCC